MASLTPTKSSAVLLVFAMMALTYVHSAAIPQSIQDPDHDLDSLKTQPALDSEQSLEEALQSPQGVQDSSDKAVLEVVENDKNLQGTMVEESLDREFSDTDDDDDDKDDDGDDDGDNDEDNGDGGDDDDGGDEDDDDDDEDDGDDDDDGNNDVISDDSERELEDLRPGEPANPPPPPSPAAQSQPDDVSEDELQDEDIQENELREAEDSAGEYEKALIQGMEDHEESGRRFKQQSTEEKAGTAHEDTSRPDEEDYEGYGLDDDDDDDDDDDEDEKDFIEISDVIKPVDVASEVNSNSAAFQSLHEARVLPSNTGFTPKLPESLSPEEGVEPRRPYLDDVIVSDNDVTHDDVKRGDKTMKTGHPALRVIELNETLYLNNTDDNEPKFRPVRIPDKFEDYDINRDGLISLPEVRHVTGAVEGAREAFRDADRDGDGWVERDEFDLAGWGMQMNPSPTPPPTPPPQRRVVFVPREDLHPSSIPRGPDDVTSRRKYGRRRH